jgi:hypothetical protein
MIHGHDGRDSQPSVVRKLRSCEEHDEAVRACVGGSSWHRNDVANCEVSVRTRALPNLIDHDLRMFSAFAESAVSDSSGAGGLRANKGRPKVFDGNPRDRRGTRCHGTDQQPLPSTTCGALHLTRIS